MKVKNICLVLAFALFASVSAEAQNKIGSSVFGNGGAVTSNSSHRIVGTLGQPAIGIVSNNDNIHQAGFWFTTFDLVTSVEPIEDDLLPRQFRLEQNYPNPFNPMTTIQFSVPKSSNVTLKVYDILGRRVTTLVDEEYQPGTYKVTFEAGALATGVYVYRIQAEGFVQTRKLMLLK